MSNSWRGVGPLSQIVTFFVNSCLQCLNHTSGQIATIRQRKVKFRLCSCVLRKTNMHINDAPALPWLAEVVGVAGTADVRSLEQSRYDREVNVTTTTARQRWNVQ